LNNTSNYAKRDAVARGTPKICHRRQKVGLRNQNIIPKVFTKLAVTSHGIQRVKKRLGLMAKWD